MGKLQGKIALITGGTTGIGLATAKLFHAQGAKVFVTGRNDTSLAAAKTELPNDVTIIKSDAGSLADIKKLITDMLVQTSKIDVLFLNAGIVKMQPFEATSEADFDSMFNINLKGPYFTIQHALPLLSKGASIILTSSIAGHKGHGMMAAYSASKAGLLSLSQLLSAHLAAREIRVNSISPGPIATPIYGKAGMPQEVMDGLALSMIDTVPMHRFGNPDEVAKAALFLACEDASYITGADILVDGGYLAA